MNSLLLNIPFILLSTLVGSVFAQPKTLTGVDINNAARYGYQDKNSISRIIGKQVTLTLTRRPKTIYFTFLEDPGIVVVCPQNSNFAGGQITASVLSLELDVDAGAEDLNVLKLSSCEVS